MTKPKITIINPDKLWQLTLRFPPVIGMSTNCWLMRDSDDLTLIDCGCAWHAEEIVHASRQFGQIKRIIITHGHPDHAGAAAAISRALNIPVFAHEKEIEFLTGEKAVSSEFGSLICRCILKIADTAGFVIPKVENCLPLQDEQQISGFKVLHTPGHTPGSISLFETSTKALFCGDNLHTMFPKPVMGHDWFTLDKNKRNSCLERYTNLDISHLLAGHGKPYESQTLSAELNDLIARH
ncbi:MAG TPA: MBL fold metallo-hydrolase [Candidatus Melainabacteria bacterium]|nr:MBL fold metallo-hydrolase [Candidatus Melainabacteria bacterium]